jgi:DNA ligase-associated metallophosphoesterase
MMRPIPSFSRVRRSWPTGRGRSGGPGSNCSRSRTCISRRARASPARYAPRVVIALGDSFHDGEGPARLAPADRDALAALQAGRDFVWIAGNHDRDAAWGGSAVSEITIGTLTFRHEPQPGARPGEVAGHLHPVARIAAPGRSIRRRCFVGDADRLILPAFGAYAGGLNVRDEAFAPLFGPGGFTVRLLGETRVHAFAAAHCLPDERQGRHPG